MQGAVIVIQYLVYHNIQILFHWFMQGCQVAANRMRSYNDHAGIWAYVTKLLYQSLHWQETPHHSTGYSTNTQGAHKSDQALVLMPAGWLGRGRRAHCPKLEIS